MKQHKITIVGAGSFLGRNLKRFISRVPIERLTLYSSQKSSSEIRLFRYPEQLFNATELLDADIIFYCAAGGVQSGCADPIETIYQLNSIIPIQLINDLSAKGYQGSIVTFGSYFEIGAYNQIHFFSEKEVIEANNTIPNHYCNSKRLLTRFYSGQTHSVKWYHFILPTIYGKDESPNRLIPYLIKSLRNNSPVQMTAGAQIRQYLHIDDLCRLLTVELLEKPTLTPDIYNIAPEGYIKISDIVEEIEKVIGSALSNKESITRSDESMKVLLLSDEKIRSSSSWKPQFSLTKGIESYLELA